MQALAVSPRNHAALASTQAVSHFVHLLETCIDRADFAAVLPACLLCLRNLATDGSMASRMSDLSVVGKCNALLQNQSTESAVVRHVVAVLANLALVPEVKVRNGCMRVGTRGVYPCSMRSRSSAHILLCFACRVASLARHWIGWSPR